MKLLEEKIIKILKPEDLPSIREVESLPRGVRLILLFENGVGIDKEKIGKEWETRFSDHLVGINLIRNEISLLRLILPNEVVHHQVFFEKCGIEYGKQARYLVNQFMTHFKVPPHDGVPFKTLHWFRNPYFKKSGKIGEWKYSFHGFHCGFTHKSTELTIEASLVFGENYGELDPFFFGEFIKTNPDFIPLPIPIYDSYHDGKRIVETMLKLGKFKKIKAQIEGKTGVIAKNLL